MWSRRDGLKLLIFAFERNGPKAAREALKTTVRSRFYCLSHFDIAPLTLPLPLHIRQRNTARIGKVRAAGEASYFAKRGQKNLTFRYVSVGVAESKVHRN